MGAPLFTASGGERADACPPSSALPGTSRMGMPAERGNAIHLFIRRVLVGTDRATALALVEPQWQATCAGINFQRVCSDLTSIRSEVAYAWNVRTRKAREIGVNLDRNYGPLDPWEIPGTLDVEGFDFRKRPVVWDTKTGQAVAPVKSNWQMRFFGCVLADIHGQDEIEGRIGYIREDGYVRPDVGTFGAFELDEFADLLEDAAVRAAKAREDYAQGNPIRVVKGDWCTYCEAALSCPGNVALARTMVMDIDDLSGRVLKDLAAMTPRQLGDVHEKLADVKRGVKLIDDGLNACAEATHFELSDGRTVEMTTQEREYFQTDQAIALLREKGATDKEIAALYDRRTVSGGRRIKGRKALPKKGRAA